MAGAEEMRENRRHGLELRWCGLAENIKGVICYRPSDGNVFVAGNVKTIENPNEYGKLLNMTVTAYDLQDSVEYKKLINFPEHIQTEPTVKRFDRIIKHQVQFSEDDEQSYAICLILTENQSTPFWIRLDALLLSDVEYFDKIFEYYVINYDGEQFPCEMTVHVENKNVDVGIAGIVTGCHKLSKERLSVFTVDGNLKYHACKRILEFKDKFNVLYTSLLTNVAQMGEHAHYVDPVNRKDAQTRHDWLIPGGWNEAEITEVSRLIEGNWCVDWCEHPPPGKVVHTSRFVYQYQVMADGTFYRRKVRKRFLRGVLLGK